MKTLVLFAALLSFAASAHAVPAVDQENDPGGGTAIAFGGAWGRSFPAPPFVEFLPGRMLAQSITLGQAGTVSRVDLMIGWDALQAFSTATLSITVGLPGAGPGLGSTVIDLTALPATSTPSEFVSVVLSIPFEAAVGQVISLELAGGGELGNSALGQSYWATGGTYSGGSAYTRCVDPNGSCGGKTSWVEVGTDFGFRVYVPEPGTGVLLAGGMIAIACGSRARRRVSS